MTMPAVIACLAAPSAQLLVGGLPLLTRHLRELHKLGVRDFYLLGVSRVPPAVLPSRLPHDAMLHAVPAAEEQLPQQIQALHLSSQRLLLVRSDCLIDPRLLAELLSRWPPHWLRLPAASADGLPAAACLSPALLTIWATAGLVPWLHESPELQPALLDSYSPAHRGPVPFYVLAIATPADAEAATKTLIHTAQKRALDLPALLLDPLFENRLVFWLCKTRFTPNHVTLCTAGLAAIITLLFLNGWLRLGILLAYVVEVLDGVDGKLARTRLQTSRLGEFEHVLDFFTEHAWYLAITIFLVTSTGNGKLWWIGGGLMASDLTDNLLYYLGQVLLGKQLDELGRFDRRFRLIGGRRNIYAWMFLFGFWAGFPVQILTMAFVWAIITVGVHSVRLVSHVRQRSAIA